MFQGNESDFKITPTHTTPENLPGSSLKTPIAEKQDSYDDENKEYGSDSEKAEEETDSEEAEEQEEILAEQKAKD